MKLNYDAVHEHYVVMNEFCDVPNVCYDCTL